jgi:hypothetical protein
LEASGAGAHLSLVQQQPVLAGNVLLPLDLRREVRRFLLLHVVVDTALVCEAALSLTIMKETGPSEGDMLAKKEE